MERIICAAIHNPDEIDLAGKPLIYCGLRHNNILWQGKHVSRNPYHQGFLTNRGRFVNREDAMKIAIEAKQVNPEDTHHNTDLFSEDLY